MKANAEEIKVIAMATKIIKEATFVQTSTSFLQMTMDTAMQSAQSKIAKFVRKIAKEQHSSELAQLASRIIAMSRAGAFQTSDPFVKIRGMISEMITKLDAQMGAEAQEKAYCDEEMSKTEEKKTKLETLVEKLTNKIDKSSDRSEELNEQVAVLQEELATLAKEQETMDKVRADEHATYVTVKADLDKGLAGIRKALDLLKDYYGAGSAAALVQEDASQPAPPAGHQAEGGAGGSIISILEVAEDDMAKELAKVEMEEADSASAYEETTQENKVTKASKNQDVKYKEQEAAGLDKLITEVSNDRDGTNEELGTVNAYYMKLQGRCVAQPESYEVRKKAREAEIKGLKEALEVLENEAALVQRGSKNGRNMRGALQL
jgi:chromosome segregation ATPase